jgi:hypothetical protein
MLRRSPLTLSSEMLGPGVGWELFEQKVAKEAKENLRRPFGSVQGPRSAEKIALARLTASKPFEQKAAKEAKGVRSWAPANVHSACTFRFHIVAREITKDRPADR